MDESINKRFSYLGISNIDLVEDKSVDTIVNKMTSIERLRWLKKKWTDRKNNLTIRFEGALITILEHKINAVDVCIKLISYDKEGKL